MSFFCAQSHLNRISARSHRMLARNAAAHARSTNTLADKHERRRFVLVSLFCLRVVWLHVFIVWLVRSTRRFDLWFLHFCCVVRFCVVQVRFLWCWCFSVFQLCVFRYAFSDFRFRPATSDLRFRPLRAATANTANNSWTTLLTLKEVEGVVRVVKGFTSN